MTVTLVQVVHGRDPRRERAAPNSLASGRRGKDLWTHLGKPATDPRVHFLMSPPVQFPLSLDT